jgi:hypothetical protein
MAHRLGNDARRAWEAHDAARARGDAHVYTLAQWESNLPSTYEFRHVTVAPHSWPRAVPLSLEEYTANFDARFGEVGAILRSTENVCVCGGAALAPFCGQAGDIDFFVYGLDERRVWLKADELVRKIGAAFGKEIRQELAPGVITLRVADAPKMQIIMRVYESMPRVLYSFDIGVCGVAFDGSEVHMSHLAAFELVHRAIVVVPEYRSPSFGHRLAKYARRGFALVLLDARLPPKSVFTVGDLRVCPSLVWGRFVVGRVEAVSAPVSDYEPSRVSRWRNVEQVSSREHRFTVTGTVGGRAPRPLELAAYADAPPTLGTVLSQRELCDALRDSARATVDRRGNVNVRVLRRVFRLTDAEIAAFVLAASRALLAHRRVDPAAALRRFSQPIVDAYETIPQRIVWVLAASVSSTRTHTPSTPQEWYGPMYGRLREPTKSEIIAMLHARACAVVDPRGSLDGTCALCLGPVHGGGKNSVTLRCRHTFHFGETESGCRGLAAWSVLSSACPMCRQDTGLPAKSCKDFVPSLEVAWPTS